MKTAWCEVYEIQLLVRRNALAVSIGIHHRVCPDSGFSYLPCHAFVTPTLHNAASQKDLAPSTENPAKCRFFFVPSTCFSRNTHRTQRRLSRQKDLTPYREPAMRGLFVSAIPAAKLPTPSNGLHEGESRFGVLRWELCKSFANRRQQKRAHLSVSPSRPPSRADFVW